MPVPVAEDSGPRGGPRPNRKRIYKANPSQKRIPAAGTKRERASGVRRRKEGQGSANINNHPPPPRLLLVKQTLHRLRNSSTPV